LVILQRKRAKLFHIVTVNTETHQVTEGSWFRGVIYGIDCDVSCDGRYMVYHARASRSQNATWSGVCRLPWLKTLVHVESVMSGGGYFAAPGELRTRGWDCSERVASGEIPFNIARSEASHFGYELGVIFPRLDRDGFTRLGDNWGDEQEIDGKQYCVACIGDDGWGRSPAPDYPTLQVRYLGYLGDAAHTFGFALTDYPNVVDGASWATWDSRNTLWVARPGVVEQYTLADIRTGTPSFTLDVDRFEPPWAEGADASADEGAEQPDVSSP
jgi:hypothetical protein